MYPIAVDSVVENELLVIKKRGRKVLLTRLEDQSIVAFASDCPHAAADLSKGDLHRGRITCPDHDWKFDLRTGRVLWPEDEVCALKRYAISYSADQTKITVELGQR